MKQKILLKTMLLLCALVAGSTSVWAVDETKTEGFETASTSTTYNSTVTVAANKSDCGIGWSIYYGTVSTNSKIAGNNSAQMRWYSSATSNLPYLKTTTAIDNLTNVSFKAKVGNTDVKMDVDYSADGTNWTNIASGVTFSNTSVCDFSYDVPSGGKYIKIGVSSSSTAPSSGNYAFIVDNVVFTYTSGSSAVATTTTIDASGITNTDVNTSTAAGSLSATVTVTAGGAAVPSANVTWTSSDTGVATVGETTGVVTLVAAGTTTITATYAGVENEYQPSEKTYNLTVTNSAPATLPFEWAGGTSAALLAETGVTAYGLGSDYASHAPYYVKFDTDGDYIQIITDSQPDKVTIGVKMVGGNTTSTITVQESSNGTDFTDVEELTISGSQNSTLTLETTDPFAASTRYVKLVFTKGSNVGLGPITITKVTPPVAVAGVSLKNSAILAVGDIETLTPTFTPADATNKNVSWESSDDAVAEVVDGVVTAVSEGTATITVTTADGGFTATCDVTVVTEKGTLEYPYSVADVKNGDAAGKTDVYVIGYIVGNYNSTAPIKSGGSLTNTNFALADEVGETTGSKTIPVELTDGSGFRPSWGPASNANNIDVAKVIIKGNGQTYFSTNAIKGTSEIEKVAEAVNVTSVGYGTWASDSPLDFTGKDIKAYIATANGRTGVTFTQVNKVPANTGVLLQHSGVKTEEIPVFDGTGAYDTSDNVFVPGTGAAVASFDGDLHNYVLNKPSVSDPIGFYQAAGLIVPVGKAYIQIDYATVAAVKEFIALPGMEDDATGIEGVQDVQEVQGAIYNLAGQRLNKMQKGINIVNGKKILY